MKISEETRKWARIISALEPLEEQIRAGQLSLEQAQQQLTGELRRDMEQDLARITAEATAVAQMTDDDLKAEWDEIVPKDAVHSVVHSIREDAEKTIRVLEIGRRLLADKPAVHKAPKGQDPSDADGLLTMPVNHYVKEHLEAQMQAGKNWQSKGVWEPNPQGGPPSIHKRYPDGGRVHITISGAEFEAAEQAAEQIQAAVQATMEQYGALSVDVTLALLGILGDPRQVPDYPIETAVYLSTKTILKNKAFERYGKDGRLMEKQVADIMNALSKLRLYFRGVKVDSREAITLPEGKLFEIEKSYKEQMDIDGKWVIVETGWVVRIGIWATVFLKPGVRIWLCDIARDVLALDHRDNRQAAQMAKFIWVRFLGPMGGRQNEKGPVRVRVRVLLEAIGFLLVKAERNKDWYRRTRENLERAFQKLLFLGALAKWFYSDDCPNIEDRKAYTGHSNEEKWLDSFVTLIDPAILPEKERRLLLPKPKNEKDPVYRAFLRAARIDEQRANQKKPGPKGEPKPRRERLAPAKQTPLANAQERLALPETRAALKNKRLSLGLLQDELARRLGISRQTYGNIERGEFAPGDRTGTAEKLMNWLDSPEG